ncbi:MAG: hypothetical protein IT260_15545 [Saprospiraceae bacterium]|nr:hypothetical protein [Saprospiraceae bacterium]
MATQSFRDVILREKEMLRLRRQKLQQEHGTPEQENWFGLALSGGGIRSATINMGFLKTLNRFGILKKADYLSTVSGGGYTHAYIQATVKETESLEQLFTEEHAEAMRQHGEYLAPGQGFWKIGNTFLLALAFFVSWCMSIMSPLIIGGILYYAYGILASLLGSNPFADVGLPAAQIATWVLYGAGAVFVVHFITNVMLNFSLSVSKLFNWVESVLIVLVLAMYAWIMLTDLRGYQSETPELLDALLKMTILFVLGFYINPNAISFHRYYRKQLSDLYLRFNSHRRNIPLKDLFDANSSELKQYLAPYPLINTCLNLQNPGGDEKFKGAKASDYFLLSPLFCGSKLTGYVPTSFYDDYRSMTLPAAVTISAAAVNPGLGVYSNKMLSVLMTLFNARLGFWVSNPLVLTKAYSMVWWPIYFFRELLGRIGTNNTMVNISDGGHIENLGVYELLRRGCRLIIAVDAGEDRAYTFADLNNMLIRVRNELGLEIRFRDDQQPEDLIRPRPSQVYSKQRFAIADVLQWWEDQKIIDPATQEERNEIVNFDEPKKVGTFIYVKSSVTAPTGKPHLEKSEDLKYGTYKYKIYHPDFPHESTSDQFFDPIQWESYYQLGQYIGADVLGLKDLEAYDEKNAPQFSVEALIDWFDSPKVCPLFAAPAASRPAVDSDIFESARETPPAAEPEVKYRM